MSNNQHGRDPLPDAEPQSTPLIPVDATDASEADDLAEFAALVADIAAKAEPGTAVTAMPLDLFNAGGKHE